MTEAGFKRYNMCGMKSSDAQLRRQEGGGSGRVRPRLLGPQRRDVEAVAIKKIPKAFEDIIDCKRLLREIKILKHFKHDNVLGLVDILAPPNANAKEWKDVYIVSG